MEGAKDEGSHTKDGKVVCLSCIWYTILYTSSKHKSHNIGYIAHNIDIKSIYNRDKFSIFIG